MSAPQNGPRRRKEKARRTARLARWRMTPEQQAVAWAFGRYNDDDAFRTTQVEIGVVLSVDRANGMLRPGPDVL